MVIENFIFANDTEVIQPWYAFVLNLNSSLFTEHYYLLSVFYVPWIHESKDFFDL